MLGQRACMYYILIHVVKLPFEKGFTNWLSLPMTPCGTFSILVLGLPLDSTLCHRGGHPSAEEIWVDTCFCTRPWDHELLGKHCHQGHFLRVATEVCGTAAAALLEAEKVNHEAWESLLKKWLWWMLSIVLSTLHIEAAWLIWSDFAGEQKLQVADCPFQRWLQHQLPLHVLVYDGTLSCPSTGTVLFLSSWIWASLGPIESGGSDALPEFLNHKYGSKIRWRLLYVIKFWSNLLHSHDNWNTQPPLIGEDKLVMCSSF